MADAPRYITPDELFNRWQGIIGKETLRNWRCQGKGPGYVNMGGRRVLYLLDEVETWEAKRTMRYMSPPGIKAVAEVLPPVAA